MSRTAHSAHTDAAGGDDVDQIPPALITGGGLTGILTFLIVAFVRGWIVTAPTHREIVQIKDQQIADKDAQVVMWRAVGETSQAQMGELLEHSRVSVHLLQGIADKAQS